MSKSRGYGQWREVRRCKLGDLTERKMPNILRRGGGKEFDKQGGNAAKMERFLKNRVFKSGGLWRAEGDTTL